MWPPIKALYIPHSSLTCLPAALWAGKWPNAWTRIWLWMHWSKLCTLETSPNTSFTTAIGAASVGSTGDSYDNALAETVNGLYKTEVIHHQKPWRRMVDVELAKLNWVDWFNNRRLLSSIGYVPPAEFEMTYYRQLEESAKVA